MNNLTLTAGVGRANITPPVGNRFLGYILRIEPATGVDTELFATALVLADERAKVAILDVDLATFTVPRSDEIRSKVAEAIGTTMDHVLLAYSHTHNGPSVEGGRFAQLTEAETHYVDNLAAYIVGAAKLADANRRPARVAAGSGTAPIAINRIETMANGTIILGQNPEGRTDHEVKVVRIDALDGKPIAAIVNYAAHPVVLGPDPMLVSADYPGVVREVVERATGATCLYLMGAAGDQMPVDAWTEDTATVRKVGNILGHEAASVYFGIETRRTETTKRLVISLAEVLAYDVHEVPGSTHSFLGAAERRIGLPFMALPTLADAERVLREKSEELAAARARDDARMVYIGEIEVTWATRVLDAIKSGKVPQPVMGVVQAIRIDDVAILTAPGECFAGIGLEAKARSPLKQTLFASYANGALGYIRTPDAYPKPGVRAVTPDAIAHKWTFATPFAPEVAGLVVDTGLELLEGLA
jgi:neutral ceramidase